MRGAQRMLAELGLASLTEVTLANGRRADVMAVGPKGEIVILEVKSCLQDFATDQKMARIRALLRPLLFRRRLRFPEGAHSRRTPASWSATASAAPSCASARRSPLVAARRKAVTLSFARLAAARLMRAGEPAPTSPPNLQSIKHSDLRVTPAMPLLYPIAPNARAALDAEGGARTIAEAREIVGRAGRADLRLAASPARRTPGRAGQGRVRHRPRLRPALRRRQGPPGHRRHLLEAGHGREDQGEEAARPKSLRRPAWQKTTPTISISTSPAKAKGGRREQARNRAIPTSSTCSALISRAPSISIPTTPSVVIVDEEGDGASFGGVDEKS